MSSEIKSSVKLLNIEIIGMRPAIALMLAVGEVQKALTIHSTALFCIFWSILR